MCCYRYLRSKTKMGFSAYHLTGETEMEKGNRVVIPGWDEHCYRNIKKGFQLNLERQKKLPQGN